MGFANCLNLAQLITGRAAGQLRGLWASLGGGAAAELAGLRAASLGRPCTALGSGRDISLC